MIYTDGLRGYFVRRTEFHKRENLYIHKRQVYIRTHMRLNKKINITLIAAFLAMLSLVSVGVSGVACAAEPSRQGANHLSADSWYEQGLAHREADRFKKAVEAYSKAISLNPEYADAYYNRGNVYADLKQYDRAIADFGKAISIDPEFAAAYINRGYVYMVGLHKTKEACADWKKACSLGDCEIYNLAKQKGDCK